MLQLHFCPELSWVLSPIFLAQIIWNKKSSYITILEIRKVYININFSTFTTQGPGIQWPLTLPPDMNKSLELEQTAVCCILTKLPVPMFITVVSSLAHWAEVRGHGDTETLPRHLATPVSPGTRQQLAWLSVLSLPPVTAAPAMIGWYCNAMILYDMIK